MTREDYLAQLRRQEEQLQDKENKLRADLKSVRYFQEVKDHLHSRLSCDLGELAYKYREPSYFFDDLEAEVRDDHYRTMGLLEETEDSLIKDRHRTEDALEEVYHGRMTMLRKEETNEH